jgi:hypothetical protein
MQSCTYVMPWIGACVLVARYGLREDRNRRRWLRRWGRHDMRWQSLWENWYQGGGGCCLNVSPISELWEPGESCLLCEKLNMSEQPFCWAEASCCLNSFAITLCLVIIRLRWSNWMPSRWLGFFPIFSHNSLFHEGLYSSAVKKLKN